MTALTSKPSGPGAFERAPLRFLVVDGLDWLFVERDLPGRSLTASVAQFVTQFAATSASARTVLLLNERDGIEMMLNLSRIRDLALSNFTDLHALGFSPHLSRQLGTWKPGKRIATGVRQVEFSRSQRPDDAALTLLESQILQPWLERRKSRMVSMERSVHLGDRVDHAIAIRERLRRSVRFVDANEWAKWRGIGESNPSAALGKHKQKRRVFAVQEGNRDLYPAFQFRANAEPLPAMMQVLATVPGDAQGWPLLGWFEARNPLLGNRSPADALAHDPAAVASAAATFYER
jgi:hypothetical protein